jgi:hypothetical protein
MKLLQRRRPAPVPPPTVGIPRYEPKPGTASWTLGTYDGGVNEWRAEVPEGAHFDCTEPVVVFGAGMSQDFYGGGIVRASWPYRIKRFVKRHVLRMDLDD